MFEQQCIETVKLCRKFPCLNSGRTFEDNINCKYAKV